MGIDRPGFDRAFGAPDHPDERVAALHASAPFEQDRQELEFDGREIHGLAAYAHVMPLEIDLDVSTGQAFRERDRLVFAAQNRLHAKDELYHGQRGPAENMHILATAYSSSEFKGTGTNEPMIWVIPYGKGRVFTTVMGHVFPNQTEAIRCVGFQTVIARGSEWAATGKVTLPIPADFPRDQPRLSPAQ